MWAESTVLAPLDTRMMPEASVAAAATSGCIRRNAMLATGYVPSLRDTAPGPPSTTEVRRRRRSGRRTLPWHCVRAWNVVAGATWKIGGATAARRMAARMFAPWRAERIAGHALPSDLPLVGTDQPTLAARAVRTATWIAGQVLIQRATRRPTICAPAPRFGQVRFRRRLRPPEAARFATTSDRPCVSHCLVVVWTRQSRRGCGIRLHSQIRETPGATPKSRWTVSRSTTRSWKDGSPSLRPGIKNSRSSMLG
mmetsp:Transcript_71017/g.197271  ORF Transcript_71017/g.197271 Transcript_71017/m.197271 type:complete len:253 (+) Transcript_71017:620-1378(+)